LQALSVILDLHLLLPHTIVVLSQFSPSVTDIRKNDLKIIKTIFKTF